MFKFIISGISEALYWSYTHNKIIGLIDPGAKTFKHPCYHIVRCHDITQEKSGYMQMKSLV